MTKILKLNNHILLGLAFLGALVGTALMGDWQAIGHGPCSIGGNNILEENYTALNNVTYDLIGTLDIKVHFVHVSVYNNISALLYACQITCVHVPTNYCCDIVRNIATDFEFACWDILT